MNKFVTVIQAVSHNETRSELLRDLMCWGRPEHAKQLLSSPPDGESYEEVAVLMLEVEPEWPVTAVLEEAFRASQNVHASWVKESDHCVLTPHPGLRSSSVGDLFRIEGDLYIIKSWGFEKISL